VTVARPIGSRAHVVVVLGVQFERAEVIENTTALSSCFPQHCSALMATGVDLGLDLRHKLVDRAFLRNTQSSLARMPSGCPVTQLRAQAVDPRALLAPPRVALNENLNSFHRNVFTPPYRSTVRRLARPVPRLQVMRLGPGPSPPCRAPSVAKSVRQCGFHCASAPFDRAPHGLS